MKFEDCDFKYYIYRYIRLDKNVPFYIGIGTKPDYFNNFEREYKRGFDKRKRSEYFNRIINKSKYRVEILIESNSRDFILEKEKEFIKLYGRSNNKTGILCNLTDGGENGSYNLSEESKVKMRIPWSKNRLSNDTFRVIQLTPKCEFIKEYVSTKEAAKENNINLSYLRACCAESKPACVLFHEFRWVYKHNYELENYKFKELPKNPVSKRIKAINIDTNEEKIYKSIRDCSKDINIHWVTINNALKRENKMSKNYKFKTIEYASD